MIVVIRFSYDESMTNTKLEIIAVVDEGHRAYQTFAKSFLVYV